MSHELTEGTRLLGVYFDSPDGIGYIAGRGRCVSIVVAEQFGQMNMVPWAKVIFNGMSTQFINLALCTRVQLLEE